MLVVRVIVVAAIAGEGGVSVAICVGGEPTAWVVLVRRGFWSSGVKGSLVVIRGRE